MTRSFACDACRATLPIRWELASVPAWSAAPYGGLLGERIRRLKYEAETHWAGPLGRVLHARISNLLCPQGITKDTVLVPVPLHPSRLAERGFNQAALIARALGRAGQLQVRTDWLRRSRRTEAQATLDARSRRTNVAQAFEIAKLPTAPIVLVDDVATTGKTLEECVLCVTRAGAIVRGVMTVALAGETAKMAHSKS
jgi:ComF family protein